MRDSMLQKKKEAQAKDEAKMNLPATCIKEMTEAMASLPPKALADAEGEQGE